MYFLEKKQIKNCNIFCNLHFSVGKVIVCPNQLRTPSTGPELNVAIKHIIMVDPTGYFTPHLTLMLTRVKSRLILAADYGRVWWELPDLPVASRPPVSGCNKSKLAVKCWCHCKQSRPPARQGHAVINHQKPYMIWRKFQMFLIYLVFTFKNLKCISEF